MLEFIFKIVYYGVLIFSVSFLVAILQLEDERQRHRREEEEYEEFRRRHYQDNLPS